MNSFSGKASDENNRADSDYNQLIIIKQSEKHAGFLNCLPLLHSHLFGCALSDAVTKLHILTGCNNELQIMKTMADMNIHLALKFQVEHEEEEPMDKINPLELGSDQYKLDKLFDDRSFLTDVLQHTFIDLIANRCYNSLKATNIEIGSRNLYRANLIDEEVTNKTRRRELSRQLRQQRNHIKTVLYDTNLTVDHLKCKVEDTEMHTQIRSRYIDNWQRSRIEQHDSKILNTETDQSNIISYYQARSDQEQRVHSEVELLVNISINETLMKVEQWMCKFDKDMESQDLKIAKQKNKYKDAKDKRIQLEETYATHETSMKKWLQFKAERTKAREYWDKMTNSAIIVQAWWRGMLVRLQLGPYAPARTRKARKAPPKKK